MMKKYSPEEILPMVKPEPKSRKNKTLILLDGDLVKMSSDRLYTFKVNGLACRACGIEGKYFVKERTDTEAKRPHLNLYAIYPSGEPVLMTKDHIIPKSKGGPCHTSNYQTMCAPCNLEKGNGDLTGNLDKLAQIIKKRPASELEEHIWGYSFHLRKKIVELGLLRKLSKSFSTNIIHVLSHEDGGFIIRIVTNPQ